VRITALFLLCLFAALVPVPVRSDQAEARMGSQIYNWLAKNGKIVEHSPLYDILNPIANPLKAAADPRYDAPFIFTIGRDPLPNVASVPGGRVYVSDKAFEYIKYREELAGALCHAVAHTVRHDYATLVRKNMNAGLGSVAVWAAVLSGNPFGIFLDPAKTVTNASVAGSVLTTVAGIAAIQAAERGADVEGADLCAQAGLNPWGLVWLLQNYSKSKAGGKMEMLTDTPNDRVRNLEAHFANAPDRFAKFDHDRAHATPLRP
jgi:predicted Zn-dependent protease